MSYPEEKGSKDAVVDIAVIEQDDVFGSIKEGGPNYKDVGWVSSGILMVKTQIGLGVLSIPFVLSTLGIVGGVICLLTVAVITTWSGFVVGQFKQNHKGIYNIDDAGYLMFGRIGKEIAAIASWLFMTTITGSALLGVSIALNAVSLHGTCTAVFVAVATVIVAAFASIQTLGKISWLGWIGVVSILGAIFTLAISVGVQDRPSAAPQSGPWDKEIRITYSPTFVEAVSAVSALVFSFAGTPTFFGISSEMRRIGDYNKALILCQSIVTTVYLGIGVVVYAFCGQYVASPALGSAGPLLKRVCYGIAIPGLCVTGILYTHLPAKYVFVRLLRGSEHLTANTAKHWITWLSCVFGCVLFSYVIASAIPVFGGLVSLIGALLGTILSMTLLACMWLYDNWQRRKSDRSISFKLMCAWAIFVFLIGNFLMVAGTYGSIVEIIDSYNAEGGSRAWDCADNSNST